MKLKKRRDRILKGLGDYFTLWKLTLTVVVTIIGNIVIPSLGLKSVIWQVVAKTGLAIFCSVIVIIIIDNLIRLRLFLFYNVWIKIIFGFYDKHKKALKPVKNIFNNHIDFERNTLILKSFPPKTAGDKRTFEDLGIVRNRPRFVREKDLEEKNYWRIWSFAIILLRNTLKIVRSGTQTKPCFCLEIDIREQTSGIYNNAGKTFLEENFAKAENFKINAENLSEDIEEYLNNVGDGNNPFERSLIKTPLRWASGGMCSIAKYKGRYWFVLVFRERTPVGWNLANGASENRKEFIELNRLLYREFCEEIVLLDERPIRGMEKLMHKNFKVPNYVDLPRPHEEIDHKPGYVETHNQYRFDYDDIEIIEDFESGPEIKPVETVFKIKVIDDNSRNKVDTVGNIVFTINPSEFGIEAIKVSSFEMEDNDYILDGEIWEGAKTLGRQPIMLLSVDFVKALFDNPQKDKIGSLGDICQPRPNFMRWPYKNCKDIGTIPSDMYEMFDADIEFRNAHREEILKTPNGENNDIAIRDKFWLDSFEQDFKNRKDENSQNRDIIGRDANPKWENDLLVDDDELRARNPLTVLCPVTWKVLEQLVRHNCLDKYLTNSGHAKRRADD